MNRFLWRTTGTALLIFLLGNQIPAAWGMPSNAEWADANTMSPGDPYCGYSLSWPYLPYIPANLPPKLHKKAEKIARQSEKKISALKKEIMARNLELYSLLRKPETPRSTISELSDKIASVYTDLRHSYHNFVKKIKTEVGVVPLFRHVGQAPATPQAIATGNETEQITLVPYTPLVWEISTTPEKPLSDDGNNPGKTSSAP